MTAGIPLFVRDLNKEFAVGLRGGQIRIAYFQEGKPVRFITEAAFKTLVANRPKAEAFTIEDTGVAWLKHPKRRQYREVVFAPGKIMPADVLNLWHGHAVKPRKGSVEPFLELVDALCGGDKELVKYVVAWCADLIQNPGSKCGTALVFVGDQGTGKSTLAKMLGALLGAGHSLTVSSARMIVRNFNNQLDGKLLVTLEEGSFKRHEMAAIKDLITNDKLLCEPKGIDPFETDNSLRVIVCTNESHALHAQGSERRFAVIPTGNRYKEDTQFFSKLLNWFHAEGKHALMHYLQNYDLSGIELRHVPRTEGLLLQKLESLSLFPRAIFNMLQEGEIEPGVPWRGAKEKESFREAINRHARMKEHDIGPATMGKKLRELFPDLQENRPSRQGRRREFILPPLAEARRHFERFLGQPIKWEPVEDE